ARERWIGLEALQVERRAAVELGQELEQLLLVDGTDLDEVARDGAARSLLLEGSLLERGLVDQLRLEELLADVFDHGIPAGKEHDGADAHDRRCMRRVGGSVQTASTATRRLQRLPSPPSLSGGPVASLIRIPHAAARITAC